MPSQVKPDVNTIWAATGEATPVPVEKQSLGYVEEIPFFDDFNGHMQQLSQFNQHVNQEGIPVWDNKTPYFVGGCAKSPLDSNVYRCKSDNVNTPPITTVGGAVNNAWERWSYTLLDIQGIISDIFVGTIQAFGYINPTGGWLLCNAQAVSRTTYSKLFAKIGVTYGAGDGVNTFNVPELRGETIRGLDLARGVDSGRALGSWKAGAVARHYHYLPTSGNSGPAGTNWGIRDDVLVDNGPNGSNEQPTTTSKIRTWPDSDMGNFSDENQVRGLAFPYYIKY